MGGVCYRVNFVNCLIQTLWVNLKYLGTYDHWVEPSFPYNVGTFLKEYFFQELHTSAQSDRHLCCSLPIDTGQPRYLKVQGNGENTSSYPKFDIAKM